MSFLSIISNTLIDRVVFSITSSVAKVLIGANKAVVVLSVALDAVRNSISYAYSRVIYEVFRNIEHFLTSVTHKPSIGVKISRVIG